MKNRLVGWLIGRSKQDDAPPTQEEERAGPTILQEDQQKQFEHELSILEDESGSRGERLQKEAEKEVQDAAEDSLKKLHVIQRGHCPSCGDLLRRHLFATICDSCGWHTFESPRRGPVRVHLANNEGEVQGERAYVLKTGEVLVLNRDVVVARVPAKAVSWVEYLWTDQEIEQRQRQLVNQIAVLCAWCNREADPERDGFHLVHVAFGAAQERYCFCSDECYEAFRKMYPARVHRNCYERPCGSCELCVKRYEEEADGIRMLAKDFLRMERRSAPRRVGQ